MNSRLDRNSQTLTINVAGNIVSTNINDIRSGIDKILAPALQSPTESWNTLQLDLTRTKILDSVGLNLLVSLIRELKLTQRNVACRVSDPNVYRTMTFTRLDTMMSLELAQVN